MFEIVTDRCHLSPLISLINLTRDKSLYRTFETHRRLDSNISYNLFLLLYKAKLKKRRLANNYERFSKRGFKENAPYDLVLVILSSEITLLLRLTIL